MEKHRDVPIKYKRELWDKTGMFQLLPSQFPIEVVIAPLKILWQNTALVFPGLPCFSLLFRFHVLYWTQTEAKSGRGLGTRLLLRWKGHCVFPDLPRNWEMCTKKDPNKTLNKCGIVYWGCTDYYHMVTCIVKQQCVWKHLTGFCLYISAPPLCCPCSEHHQESGGDQREETSTVHQEQVCRWLPWQHSIQQKSKYLW